MLVMMKLGWRMNMIMVANTIDTPSDLRFCYMGLTICATLNKKRSILNRKAEPTTGRLGRRRVWAILLLIAFSICFSKDYSVAYSQYKTQHYKQYTFIELNDLDQYYCIEELWHKESRWSPTAKNARSSAFGIPQMLKMKETNPFRQIDIGLRYIEHRHGTPCNALAFHNRKGYY